MMDHILAKLGDPGFLATLLVSLGCATTVLLAFMPLLQKDDMARRIKAVSTERERIRLRERERLAAANSQPKLTLRHKSGGMSKQLVDSLNLDVVAQHRHRQDEAGDGGLSRPGRREHVPRLSARRADRCSSSRA